MKIKILFLLSNFKAGGAETQFWNLVRHLNSQKFNVHVIQIENKNRIPVIREIDGIKVSVVKARFQLDPITIFRLYQYVKNNDIHLIQSLLFMDNQFARVVGLFVKIPVVTSVRGELRPILGRAKTYIELKMQMLSSRVVVNSYWLKEQLVKMGADQSKIAVIHNGIDLNNLTCEAQGFSLRTDLKIPNDAIIVGIVARLHPMKDHITYLDVMNKLIEQDKSIYGLIIGDGIEKASVENYVEQKNLVSNIFLVGEVKENIGCWYRGLDALLFTSKWGESFPNVILEAMECGVPVVATKVSAVDEIIQDQINGMLADIGDVDVLTGNLLQLLEEKDLSNKIVKNAKATVGKFSIDKMVLEYENLFESLLNES